MSERVVADANTDCSGKHLDSGMSGCSLKEYETTGAQDVPCMAVNGLVVDMNRGLRG